MLTNNKSNKSTSDEIIIISPKPDMMTKRICVYTKQCVFFLFGFYTKPYLQWES